MNIYYTGAFRGKNRLNSVERKIFTFHYTDFQNNTDHLDADATLFKVSS
ncbi:hypothetical protein D3OALGA1CA_1515 [Olavius algarvensis associated proteobacterium Delta 3]|nr:hypothetical protein D3OALGB2SA_316 [Olavius algarvensis associated proteobacterium Delta 3]CAB5102331.1 hypothetical protein D3OALGA1CA_1515 [Olavius algarvensis associated proteobacterium Delta 3]